MADSKMIDDSGPAFPTADWMAKGNTHPGMTLRDYFAAMALQGLLAGGWNIYETEGAVDLAFHYAEAMIDRRKK